MSVTPACRFFAKSKPNHQEQRVLDGFFVEDLSKVSAVDSSLNRRHDVVCMVGLRFFSSRLK